jgi:signal transduction histidine kinase
MTPRRRRALRFELSAAFVAAAVVPTLLLGGVAFGYGIRDARARVEARNRQVAAATAGEVSRFLEAQVAHVREVASAATFDVALRHAIPSLLQLHLGTTRTVRGVLLLDERGRVVHAAPFDPDLEGIDLSARPAVREARRTGAATWSSAAVELQTGSPVVELVLPGTPWTLVAHVDLASLLDIVARSGDGVEPDVAILDRDGTVIAHRERRRVREQENLRDVALVRTATEGEPPTGTFELGGERWVGSVARIPLTQWLVLVSEREAEAYATFATLRYAILIVSLAAALAGIAVGSVYARRIRRPIEVLSARALELAAGEYPAGSVLPHPVFREADELARTFEAMADAVHAREDMLARSERNYRALFATTVVGVARTSLEGTILFCNEAFAGIAEADGPEALRGLDIRGFYADPSQRDALLDEVRRAGRAANVELAFVTSKGSARTLLVNVAVDADALITVMVDITERKHAAEERERLEQELFHAQKLEAIGRLAGGVAHDFNNLLTAILGYASAMRDARLEGDEDRLNAEGIIEAARRAAHLTQSLLAYSRKQVLEAAPVDIAGVVRSLRALLGRVIGEDVELEVRLPDEPLTAVADAGQIEQVLLNLCTNARDAMPRGGRLRLAADRTLLADDAARSLGIAAGPYVRVAVTDSGTGIDPAIREKIFDPFFTTKPAGKGTGLGLSIVYGIVRQHSGHVAVDSAPGGGTTFTVLLPACEARPWRTATSRRSTVGGRETILLAEDEPLVRRVLRRTLESAGYAVVEAADGEEAVKRFTEDPDRIHLCLLDVVMPRRNGKEAAEAIAALRPGTRVLFASGYAAEVLEDRGHDRLGADFIAKPVTPEELLGKVREVLDRA